MIALVMAEGGCIVKLYMNIELVVAMISRPSFEAKGRGLETNTFYGRLECAN